MTRYEAFVEKEWRTLGMAQVVVARIREGGVEIGCFLLDLWCLGVKDAFQADNIPLSEFDAVLADTLPEERRERIHPACARKLIEGAAAYAQSLGFAPARDFRKARHVLGGIDARDCAEEFTFGRAGRPCFAEGPDEPEGRVERVLSVLTARLGADGFDFVTAEDMPGGPDDDPIGAVRDELIAFFNSEPEDVPRFYEFSGMVAALQVCPEPVMPTRLMESLWGPEGRVWANEAEAQWFADLLLHYWNFMVDLMAEETQAEDAWPLDLATNDFPDRHELAYALVDWCTGFLRTTELWPEAWGDAPTRPELVPHWDVLRAWTDLKNPGNIEVLKKNGGANAIPLAVVGLHRALRPPKPA